MNNMYTQLLCVNRLRRALVSLAALLVVGVSASAQSYRSVQAGDWNQQTTWARTSANPGTISSSLASPVVTGVGTQFQALAEVQVGDQLYETGTFALVGTVQSVDTDGQVTLVANALVALTNSGFHVGRSFPQLAADDATIISHTVSLTTAQAVNSLTIQNAAGATLDYNTNGVTLTLGAGGLTVQGTNGTISGAATGAALILNGGGVTFNTGVVNLTTTTVPIRFAAAGNITMTTAASIETLELDGVNVTVTGAGALTLRNQVAAASGTPTLINSGTINFAGATPVGAGVTLDAFTNANTVEFSNAGSFALPVLNYRSLTISGGAKDLATGTSIVTTTLTLNGVLNVGANTLNLGNNGGANTGPGAIAGTATNLTTTAASSLEMRGNAAQTIPTSVTALTNLLINNSAGGTAVTVPAGPRTVAVSGTYTMTAGGIDWNNNTLEITGNYARTGGTFISDAATIFIFNSVGTWTGTLNIGGANAIGTLRINSTGAAVPAIGSAVNVNIQLNLEAGELNLNGQNLSIVGTASCIRTAGAFRGSGTSGLIFSTSTSPAQPIVFATTLTLERLNINNAAITVTLGSNLTVSGTLGTEGLLMNAGSLDLNGFNLTASGNYARTGASFIGNAASTLTLSGATAVAAQGVAFVTTTQLAALVVNNTNATATYNLASALTVADLTLTDGELGLNGQSLAVTNNYTRTNGNFIGATGSNLDFTSTAGVYTGTLSFVTSNVLNNLTLNNTNGATQTLTVDVGGLQVDGALTLTSGNLGVPATPGVLTSNGNYTRTAPAALVGGTGTLAFTGTGTVVGSVPFVTTLSVGTLTINNTNATPQTINLGSALTVATQLNLTAAQLGLNDFALTVAGGYDQTAGSFVGSALSSLSFTGTTAIANETIPFVTNTTLASLTINNTNANAIRLGSVLNPAALNLTAGNLDLNAFDLDVAGAYTRGTGNFVGNAASSLTFSGTGTLAGQTLSFIAPRLVNNLTVSNSTTQDLAMASWLEVLGTLTLSGNTNLDIVAQRLILSGNPIAGTVTRLLGGATSDLFIAGTVAGHTVPSHLTALNTLSIMNSDAGGVGYAGPSTLVVDSLIVGTTAAGFFAPATDVNLTVNQDITVTSGQIRLSGNSLLTHLGTSSISVGVTAFNNSGTSTVFYNGAAAQDVLNGQYANLTLNNNPKTFVSAAVPDRLFNISLNFDPGTGVHTLNGAAIVMNGAVAQILQDLNSTHPAGGYGRVRIANTGGGVTLTESTTVGDSLDLVSGTFTVDAAQTLTINGITLAAPTAGRTGNLVGAAGSTVIYDRVALGQPVIRGDYANLEFQGGGKVLDGGVIEVREVFTPGAATTHTVAGSTFDFDGTAAQTLPRFNWTGALGTGYNNVIISNSAIAGVTTQVSAPGPLVSGTLAVGAGSTLTIANAETSPLNLAGAYAGAGTLVGAGDDAGLRILGGAGAPALTLPAISTLGYLEVYHSRVAAVALGGAVTVTSPRGGGAATDAALRLRNGALNNTAFNVTLPTDALILATGGTLTANPTFGATRCDLLYTNTAAGVGVLFPAGLVSFQTGFEVPAGGTLIGTASSVVVAMAADANTVFQTSNITIPGNLTLTEGRLALHDQAVATTYDLTVTGNYTRTAGEFQGTVIGGLGSNLNLGSGAGSTVTGTLNFNGAAPNLFSLTTNHTGTLAIATALNVRDDVNVNGGTLQQNVGVTIRGDLNIADGTTFAINGQTLTMGEATFASGTITSGGTNTGQLTGSATSNLLFRGTGNGQVPDMPATLVLADLDLNRTGGAIVTLNEQVDVNDDIPVTAGTIANAQNIRIINSGVTTITIANNGADRGFMTGAGGAFGTGEPDWNGQYIDIAYLFGNAGNYTMGVECPEASRNAIRNFTLNHLALAESLVVTKALLIGSTTVLAPSVMGNSQMTLTTGTLDCNGNTITFPSQNTTNPILLRTPGSAITCTPVFNNNVNLFYSGAITSTGAEVPLGSPGVVNNLTILLNTPGQVLNWVATGTVEVTTSVRLLRGVLNMNDASAVLRFGSGSSCPAGSPFWFYRTPETNMTTTSGTYEYMQCNQYRVIYLTDVTTPAFTSTLTAMNASFEVRRLAATRNVTDLYVLSPLTGATPLTVTTAAIGGDNLIQVSDSLALDFATATNRGVLNIGAAQTLEIQSNVTRGPSTATLGDITSTLTGTALYSQAAAGQNIFGKATGIAAPTTFYGNLTWTGGTKTVGAVTLPYAGTFTPNAGPHDFANTGANNTLTGTSIMVNGTAAQSIPTISTDIPNGGGYFNLHLLRTTATAIATLGGNVTVGDSNATTIATSGQLILNMTGAGFDSLGVGANQLRVGASVTRTAGAISTGGSVAGTVWFQSDLPSGASQQVVPRGEYANLNLNNIIKTLDNGGTIRIVQAFGPGTIAPTVTGNTVEYGGNGLIELRALGGAAAYNNLTIANTRDTTGGNIAVRIRAGENIIVGGAYTMTSAAAAAARRMAVGGRVSLNGQRLTLNGAIDFGDRGFFVGSNTSDLFITTGTIANSLRFVSTGAAGSQSFTLRTLSVQRGGTAGNDLTLATRLRIVGTATGEGLQYGGTDGGHEFIITGQQLDLAGRINWTATGANINGTGNSAILRVSPTASGIMQTSLFFEDGASMARMRINMFAASDAVTIRTRTSAIGTALTVGNNAATDSFSVEQGILTLVNRYDIQAGIFFSTNGFLSGNATTAGLRLQGAVANGSRMLTGSQGIRFTTGGMRLAELLLNVQTGRIIPLGSRLIAGDNTANDRFRLQNGILDINGQHLEVNGRYRRDGVNAYFRGSPTSVLVFIGTQTASNAAAEANDLRFVNGFQRLDSLVLNNTFAAGGLNAFIDLEYAGATPATSRLYVGDSTAGTGAFVLTNGVINITDGDTLQLGGNALRTGGNFNTAALGTIDAGLISYNRQSANQPVLIGQYGLLLLNNSAKAFANGIFNIAGAGLAAFSPGTATHDFDLTGGAGTRIRYNGTAAQVLRHNLISDVPNGGRYFGLELATSAGGVTIGGTNETIAVGDSTAGTGGFVLNLTGGTPALTLGAHRLALSGPITNTAGTYTGSTTSILDVRGPAGAGVVPTFTFTTGAQELLTLRMVRSTQTFTLGSALRVGQVAGTGALIIGTNATVAVGTQTLTIGNLTSDDASSSAGTWAGGSLTSAATGTVIYDRTAAGQLLIPSQYGNLTLSTSAKTLRNGGTPAAEYGIAGTFTPNAFTHNVSSNPTVTINYNGAGAQAIADFDTDLSGLGNDYPALSLTNGGPKTFNSASFVNNTFTLNLTAGTPAVVLNNATHNFIGPMTYTAGTITGSATSGIIVQPGTGGAITGSWPFTTGAQTLQTLTMNRATQTFLLGTNLTVVGTTAMNNGAIGIGAGNLLTLSGPITRASGTLSGSGTSDLTIDGTNLALPSPMFFTAAARELRNFTFNRTGTSNVFTFDTDLSVGGTAGTGSLSIGAGSEVSINGQNLILTGGIANAGTFRGGATSTLTIGGVVGSVALNVPTVTDNIQNVVVDNARPVNPPTANLAAPLTVLNQLTLTNGVLGTTVANVLTLGTNSTNGVASPVGGQLTSYIHGPVAKFLDGGESFTYPVGLEGRWRRVEVRTAAGSTADRPFTASLLVGNPVSFGRDGDLTVPDTFNVSKLEQHRIESPSGFGAIIDRVRIYWGTSSLVSTTNTDWAKLLMVRWNGAAWDSNTAGGLGSASFANNPSFTINEGFVTSRGGLNQTMSEQFYAIASTDATNPLPVTWLSLTAQWDGPSARLDWATASELNNERFEVERSLDQRTWQRIATQPGSGTTQSVRRYAYRDSDVPSASVVYYRIRQVDLDGRSSTSAVVALRRDGIANTEAFSVYPNPFRAGQLNIVGITPDIERSGPFTVRVMGTDGRLVHQRSGDLASVMELTRQALDRADAGVYILVIESKQGAERHRLVKQ